MIMKILLITPSSQQVIGFRAKLMEALQNNGADVAVLTFDDEHKAIIEAKHIEFHCVSDKNRSLNPFKV